MVQQELEEYFEKYGKIKSSKIAKTDQGHSKGYGFVMFESPRDANSAMLDYKGGNAPFQLEWYKDKSKRIDLDRLVKSTGMPIENSIMISWNNVQVKAPEITQGDVYRCFNKIGNISEVKMLSGVS